MRAVRILFGASVFVSLVAQLFVTDTNMERVLLAPSLRHWFGTDALGRDLMLRTLQGGGLSFAVALVSAALAATIGILVGLASAGASPKIDVVVMRVVDTLDSLPDVLLAAVLVVVLQTVVGESLWAVAVAMGLAHWMSMSRQARALAKREDGKLYITAARALGGSKSWILIRHIIPNISAHLWTVAYFSLPHFIVFESTLSFLGLGIQAPRASLGSLLNEGWRMLSLQPMLAVGPAAWMLVLLVGLRSSMPKQF